MKILLTFLVQSTVDESVPCTRARSAFTSSLHRPVISAALIRRTYISLKASQRIVYSNDVKTHQAVHVFETC